LHLGNLGIVFYKQQRFEDAKESLKNAIPICDQAIPPAAGSFRGTLSLIFAKQNNIEEALDLLTKGEPQVAVYPEEHGKFLCKKAQVQRLANQLQEAQSSLKKAMEIAAKLNAKPDSELGKLVSQSKELLDSPASSKSEPK